MNVDKNINFFVKALCKINTETKKSGEALEILDVGCCDGALGRTLRPFLPKNTKYFGLEQSKEMINRAKISDNKMEIKNSIYMQGNAFALPFNNSSKDAIILSSAMHELFSYPSAEYNESAYSKDTVSHFMKNAYDCLKPGGVLIIKEPAKVSIKPDEKITLCDINKNDGKTLSVKNEDELLNADISKLSTYDK